MIDTMNLETGKLAGILPVLPTPFGVDGRIDAGAMRGIVCFALDAKANGLVFPGFASEVEELSDDERRELLRVVVEETDARAPVVAGGSAETPGEVISHGRYARSLGLNHMMVQPPKSIGCRPGPVGEFLEEVAAELPDLEIILQNAPAPRGSDLAPETISRLCDRIRQIRYVKEEALPSGPAISRLVGDEPGELLGVIGGGGARFILDEYARGACAAMPAVEIADIHVQMDRAWRDGRKDEARRHYVRTLPLLALQSVYRMRLTKHVLKRRGVISETGVRAPTPEIDAFAEMDIDRNLEELRLTGDPAQRPVKDG